MIGTRHLASGPPPRYSMHMPNAARAPLLLLVAGLLAHANGFRGDFHLDDVGWILNHDRMASFRDSVLGTVNRPFAALTFYLNTPPARPGPYSFNSVAVEGGVTSPAFHAVNLA